MHYVSIKCWESFDFCVFCRMCSIISIRLELRNIYNIFDLFDIVEALPCTGGAAAIATQKTFSHMQHIKQ